MTIMRTPLIPGPTVERLKEVLDYDPETGIFRWRVYMGTGRIPPGTIAGTRGMKGYRIISIDGVRFRASRLAWLYVYGIWPALFIDHRDADTDNNRIRNLRQASNRKNQQNRRVSVRTVSGLKGAYAHHTGKWFSQIVIDGKRTWLGLFGTAADAHAAYVSAAGIHFGEFARAS